MTPNTGPATCRVVTRGSLTNVGLERKRSMGIRLVLGIGVVAAAAAAVSGQTVTVTTSADVIDISYFDGTVADLPGPDGIVSLSEAMIAANNTPGHQIIGFAIPQSEWPLQFALPGRAVVMGGLGNGSRAFEDVTIDGTTQTAFTGDTNPDGAEVAIWGATLYLNAGNSTLRGIDSTSVQLSGPDNVVQGNTGTMNITLYDATDSLIGGVNPGEGNVGGTLKIDRSHRTTVYGNTFTRFRIQGFVSPFGTGPALDNVIGGPDPAMRNFITGYGTHDGEGYPGGTTVEVFDSTGTIIENNWIGTLPDGMTSGSSASVEGVGFYGENHSVLIKDNRIAGILGIGTGPHAAGLLFGTGISVYGIGSDITIQGNTIGLDAADQPTLGSVYGINVRNHPSGAIQNVLIGGDGPGEGNVIAGHLFNGVTVNTSYSGVQLARNAIYANDDLGIDLAESGVTIFGVTPNDPLDPDLGGNNLQNFPDLASADASATSITVAGSLDSTPSSAFTIDFYASSACDPSGFGEGEVFIGSTGVTTDGAGFALFSTTMPVVVSPGWVVTATATDALGSTSEFSACATVEAGTSCTADMTTQGSAPGDPGYGVPDGQVSAADINYYVNSWVAGDAPVADVTTQGSGPGDPGYGIPDGSVTASDIQFYANMWVAGCP